MDADFEPVTQDGYKHRTCYLYPKLQTMNVDLVLCSGPDDVRQNVRVRASASTVAYLTGEGHGTSTTYEGQNRDVLFGVGGYQPVEVAKKIVHFLSCESATKLGRDMVANGCRAFFGYDGKFAYEPTFSEASLMCDSEIDLAFAEGLTAAQVYARAKERFVKTAADLRAIGSPAANRAAAHVDTNLSHLVCPTSGGPSWGDETASLYLLHATNAP